MKIKGFLYTLLVSFFFIQCNKTKKIEREGEPDVHQTDNFDKEMNDAMKKAQKTLPDFEKALQSYNPKFSNFTIKKEYQTKEGTEHIWISEIVKQGDKFYGYAENVPVSIEEVKLGDIVEIPKNKISDWMYFDDGKARGGYTIRVFRSRMSQDEQHQFDENFGVAFD